MGLGALSICNLKDGQLVSRPAVILAGRPLTSHMMRLACKALHIVIWPAVFPRYRSVSFVTTTSYALSEQTCGIPLSPVPVVLKFLYLCRALTLRPE